MHQVTSSARQKFIESVLGLAPRVAAFDCDGTIWSGDAGESFFAWEIKHGVVSAEVAQAMKSRYPDRYLVVDLPPALDTADALAFLPQAVYVWRRRSADDISLAMYLIMLTGVVLWILYGLRIHSMPLVAATPWAPA